ncbi:MAG TPA: AAA family ATPase [Trueperaceae bacterium]|nr:AAA family ATPase [Trueperaceae bacterium]
MHLRTLGGLALEGTDLKRRRPLLLLAFVALQGGATRRELADLFFMHAADPRDSLSAALGQLRRALGDSLVLEDNTVTTSIACDAVTLLTEFDDLRFESVVRTYGGPFCAGYDQMLGEELEEWLFSMREQLAARARSAQLHRSRVSAADGRLDDARRAVKLAIAMTEAPDFTEAEVAELVPHLRALDAPDLARLEAMAGEGDAGSSRSGLSQASALPVPPFPTSATARATASSPFIGRGEEVAALARLLVSPDERIVTVQGMGGIGKSRLAERLADLASEELTEAFPDGVYRVFLESVTTAGDVEAVVAARLGFAPERVTGSGVLAELLKNWRALIVIDNFEHLVEASQVLIDIAALCRGVKLLVTSRVRLGLTGERLFTLRGLEIRAAAGAISDAARLFVDRAGRVGLVGELDSGELAEIEGLCSDLDGYPLGLELAAGMLRVLPLTRLRGEIRRSLGVLAHGPADAPERHRAVRAAFEPSWRRLKRREREVALRLSVMRGGCDLDAAEAVGSGDVGTLATLVDQAFLAHDSRTGRFSFHPLVREFVAEKRPDTLFHEASFAHANYFAAVVDRAANDYRARPDAALDSVAIDIANVLSAVEWLLGCGDTSQAVALLMRLVVDCDYLEARGGGGEIAELIERCAEAGASTGDLAAANRLLARAADAYRLYTAKLGEALRVYRRALELAELAGETGRRVILHAQIGALEVFTDPTSATRHIRVALELANELGDELMLCEALNRSAYVSHALGEKEAMRRTNLEIVDVATRLLDTAGDSPQLPRIESSYYFALHNLGVAEDDLGMLEESLEHRLRALRFAEQRGHQLWAGFAHEDLTFLRVQMGAAAEARMHVMAARANFGRVGAEANLLRLEARLRVEDPAGLIAGI